MLPKEADTMRIYQNICKRPVDFIAALLALVLLLPLLLIVSIVLLFSNKGQPFFTQLRPGKGDKLFRIIKFKTMVDRYDDKGKQLPDAQRLTAIGRLIRGASIDELLQLINVLKGDMSLVGPRPLLEKYLPLYDERQAKRHDVRPGITGWAQVNGRNAISWEEKFALDVWYVDNWSLMLDAKILGMTIAKVLRREGVAAAGQATMPEFLGNDGGRDGGRVPPA
jgi:lipopolysaccharide/colanic/teichoic acid biosynthesis glycosyltransferase